MPSLTEAVARTAPDLLVGATDWCVEPAGLDVLRVGGTKYPDLERVRAAVPDLVLANAEENRREDVEALRAAGVPVWVTYPRTLDAALTSLGRLLAALGAARRLVAAAPGGLVSALHRGTPPRADPGLAAAVGGARRGHVRRRPARPARRRQRLRGGRGALSAAAAGGDAGGGRGLVVLPDEPYAFTADDGPEAFPGLPYALVSGRHLTWYGPSLVAARAVVSRSCALRSGTARRGPRRRTARRRRAARRAGRRSA